MRSDFPNGSVSDLTMPVMGGLALIRAAQEWRRNLPAVLLTGNAGDGAALAVGDAIRGTCSVLRKPVSGTQLVDRISPSLGLDRHACLQIQHAVASGKPGKRRESCAILKVGAWLQEAVKITTSGFDDLYQRPMTSTLDSDVQRRALAR